MNHIEPVISQQEPSVILLGHIDKIQKQEPKTQITII